MEFFQMFQPPRVPPPPAGTPPAEYPRATRIEDQESLLLIMECDDLAARAAAVAKSLGELQREYNALAARREAKKAELFLRLHKSHPDIEDGMPPEGGARFLKHGEEYWYVSWGEVRE